jgi:Xaa-Pro aminopeptidase
MQHATVISAGTRLAKRSSLVLGTVSSIPRVGDVLIYADSIRSPELRHEIPVPVPDPFLYAERNGRRVAVVTAFEIPRITEAAPGVELIPPEHFGIDELLAGGMDRDEADLEVCVRACRELGIAEASAPATFPLALADRLRDHAIEIRSDRGLFNGRRRVKNEAELAGIVRAQRGCEAALDAARALLGRADRGDGALLLDGEPLTCERVKREILDAFGRHDVVGDEFIVSHGPQTAIGHDMGSGPIAPDEPIVFDLFPRDRATGCYADMTRTYVVGTPSDELVEWHGLCHEALQRAIAAVRTGVNGRALMELVCDLFQEHGHPTQLSKRPGQVLEDGFYHGLGHGVGLEVHERPSLGRVGDDLVAGDVIAIEPGLYRNGWGGVRLENLVLVTDDGPEPLTQYPLDLSP